MIKIIKTKFGANVAGQYQKDCAALNAFLELNTNPDGYCAYEVVEADGILIERDVDYDPALDRLIETENTFIPTGKDYVWVVLSTQYEVILINPIFYSENCFEEDGFVEFTDKSLFDKYTNKYKTKVYKVYESDGVYRIAFNSYLFDIEKSLQEFFGDELYTRYLPLRYHLKDRLCK